MLSATILNGSLTATTQLHIPFVTLGFDDIVSEGIIRSRAIHQDYQLILEYNKIWHANVDNRLSSAETL